MNKHSPITKRARFSVRTLTYYFVAVASLLSGALPASASALADPQQQQSCRKIGDFSVCGRFLDEWNTQGSDQASTYVNGLPITEQRPEISLVDGKAYDTQWFERAKYETHPENKAPYDVQLGLLGTSLAEGRGIVDPYTHKVRNASDVAFVGIDKPADADGPTRVWFPETRHSIAGKILEYWNLYGGLSQFGFPLSEPFQEISEADNKIYTVQYFERNRFELHPENAAPYEVELGLLGVQQYKMTPVAGNDLPAAPPPGVKSSKDTLIIGTDTEPFSVSGLYADANFLGLGGPILWLSLGNLSWYAPTIENGGAHFVGVGDDQHLQVKFKMRPGMKWSDGVEITSNDVLFSYKTERDPDFQFGTGSQELYNIDNPDKFTVIDNYYSFAQARDLYATDKDNFEYLKHYVDEGKPVTDFNYAAPAYVWPEHILSKIPYLKRADLGYYTDPKLLVTSGSFKVERWDHGQQLVLVPNPYYSLTAPPILKKVAFRFVSDRDTLIAQLKSGDVDVLLSNTFPAPDVQLTQLELAGFTVDDVPTQTWEFLEFNLDRPYFQDKTVRQAIAYAIDRQKVASTISLGKWLVQKSFVTPDRWTSVENPNFPEEWKEKFPLHLYPYDAAKANQLLDQAGWPKGPDGIRTKNGVRLSFRYETTNIPLRIQAQSLVESYLQAVGIEAKTAQLPRNDFFDAHASRDFDFDEYALAGGEDVGGEAYDSANIPTLENDFTGDNASGYRNPHFDELSRASLDELDRSKLYPLEAEMQSIYSEDLPSIPLFTRTAIDVHNPKLQNWNSDGLGNVTMLYFK